VKPNRPAAPPRSPPRGELLFEFYRERDRTRWLCELRQHPEPYGIDAQFYRNEEFDHSRRFDHTMSRERMPREMANALAHAWRKVRAPERRPRFESRKRSPNDVSARG
jgi:hypothetical protein